MQVHRIELSPKERDLVELVAFSKAAKDLTIPVAAGVAVGAVSIASYTLYQWLKDGEFTPLGSIFNLALRPIAGVADATGQAAGGFFGWIGKGWSAFKGEVKEGLTGE